MTSPNLLKLQAKDPEDVQVISAVLQDAIAPVVDMIFRPDQKDFVMVVHRFRSEGARDPVTGCHERVRCAVHVNGVSGAQVQGIDQARPGGILDLLAVIPENGNLHFIFAGGGKIRLKLDDWSMILEDFGEPWPTAKCPHHPDENAAT